MTGQPSHLPWYSKLILGAYLGAAVGTLACTGHVAPETGPGSEPRPGGGGNVNPSGPPGGGGGVTGNPPGGSGGGAVGVPPVPGAPTPLVLDSGRTVIRRLNRDEYSLTVRDLLGTTTIVGDKLPAENLANGFDTVGEYLALSPAYLDAIDAATTTLIDELFALPASDAKRAKVFVCPLTAGSEAACARQILTKFTRGAYRRPATKAELDALMVLVDKARVGGTYNDGLKAALTAVLLSPHFIYKEETSVGKGAPSTPKPLNAFELATRLSYFLWSTMPDDALSASADSGKLASDPAELKVQIERMIADPKASLLTSSFATKWLALQRLETHETDTKVYPSYDAALPIAARQETEMFFSRLIADNLPLTTLLDADFTYVNARLASHYGVTATGTGFARVSLAGTPRAGILTQTSFLMMNAHPDSSSVVTRGDWILQRILCAETPPAPDDVNTELPPPKPGSTGRQLLDEHRKGGSTCNACHQFIDPLGFGLESFDGIGAYRTMDSGKPVDATGTYPNGPAFNGAKELIPLIAKDPRFPACVTKQLLTYSVGRAFASDDAKTYAKALAEHGLKDQQGSWRSWIAMVASSEAFRTNRPEAE